MPFLKRVFFHDTLDKWLIALAAAVGLWVILLVLRKALRRRLAVLARKTATPLDDAAVLMMSKIKGWFSLIVSVYAGSLVLKLPPKLVGVLDKVVVMAETADLASEIDLERAQEARRVGRMRRKGRR